MYGKGRVFYGSFAHSSATWDSRDVQQMYYEAIKWSLGLTNADLKVVSYRHDACRGAVTHSGELFRPSLAHSPAEVERC